MIKNLFLSVFNMSITGTVAVIGVLAVRLVLKKMPKIYSYILWSIVLFRLLCPYSFSLDTSVFGAVPSVRTENGRIKYTIPQEIVPADIAQNTIAMPDVDFSVEIFTAENVESGPSDVPVEDTESIFVPQPTENKIVVNEINSFDFLDFAAYIWLRGVVYFICSNLTELWDMGKILSDSIHIQNNIYQNGNIPTAFIMGLVKPKIYLPDNLDGRQKDYVIMHEQTHIKRKDYIFKFAGFFALCLHWFNPAVWLAFKLAEKDMEMSCDEAVIKNMSRREKRRYSTTLLSIGAGYRLGSTAPAFSEGETTDRIKNVLEYIKPSYRYIAAVTVIMITAVAALAFNPSKPSIKDISKGYKQVYLATAKDYRELSDGDFSSFTKQLNRIDILPLENTSTFVPETYVVFADKNDKTAINISMDYKSIQVKKDEDLTYYSVNNPDDLKNLFDEYINSLVPAENKISITLPAFAEQTLSSGKGAPFTVETLLENNWTVAAKENDKYATIHNLVGIYNRVGRHEASVGYGYYDKNLYNPEEIFVTLSPNPLDSSFKDYYETVKETEWGWVAVSAAKQIMAYNKDIGCYVTIAFQQSDTEYDVITDIAENLVIKPAQSQNTDIPVSKFRLSPGADIQTIGQTAAKVYFENFGNFISYADDGIIIYTSEEFQYNNELVSNIWAVNGRHFDYIVTTLYYPENTELVTEVWICVDKIDDGNYEIVFSQAGNVYGSLRPVVKKETKTVERVVQNCLPDKIVKDSTTNLGTSEILYEGEYGLEKQTVIIETINGIVTGERVLKTQILKEPEERIIAQGTLWNGIPITGASGKLIWPTADGRVSRGFVDQYPNHNGLDIAAATGTHIYAAADGVVAKALYTNRGYGVYLEIEHGGYQTLYGQCSKLLVSTGEVVKQGQVIAYIGSTGNSTGPHLHFEVKEGSVRYNPYEWF